MSENEAVMELPESPAVEASNPAPHRVAPPVVKIDESRLAAMYANFCRVTGTPEELILDFGLNTQPPGVVDEPIAVQQRIVTNYFTAKRMLAALKMSVERHEATFGALETDVRKRAAGGRNGRN